MLTSSVEYGLQDLCKVRPCCTRGGVSPPVPLCWGAPEDDPKNDLRWP